MLRFLPYILLLGLGFVAGAILVRRSGPGSNTNWEAKYREIFNRHRDLTRQLQGAEDRGDLKASKLRQRLQEIVGILRSEEPEAATRIQVALEKTESALREV